MAQYISTNVTSLVAQSNLAKSSNALAGNLERLSSGQRINSASDDAAGMAIASRMTSQIRGNEMAKRNTADAISMTQTAEGAMGVQVEQLQRARELAVQSANGMLADSDRSKLDNEQNALMAEFDKVATETTFNDNNLLDGTGAATVSFQVGANSNETRDVKMVNTTASALTHSFVSDGVTAQSAVDAQSAVSADIYKTSTPVATGSVALTDAIDISSMVNSGDTLTIKSGETAFVDNGALTLDTTSGKIDIAAITIGSATGSTTSVYELKDANGNLKSELTFTAAVSNSTSGSEAGTMALTAHTAVEASAKQDAVAAVTAGTVTSQNLTSMSLTTQQGALESIDVIDAALDTVQTARSNMGTYQNRFDQVQTNLDVSLANTSASRGRIQDADFAKETADMTKNQILSQAGVAMLSQANQLPQNVLSLLR